MQKEIIINESIGETRLAIQEDGKLAELHFERPESQRMLGDIYLGRVAKVIKGIQAAFIDIGMKQDAFLHFSDIGDNLADFNKLLGIEPSQNRKPSRRRRQSSSSGNDVPIRPGQSILVQVTKEPIANKGARVTTNLTLPGRFLVLLPYHSMVGVSRKIHSRKERRRLKTLGRKICPDGFGVVVRTFSEDKTEETLSSDFDVLLKNWAQVKRKIKKSDPPQLIFKDMGMLSSVIRDLFTSDVTRLIVDSKKMHRQIVKYLKEVSPQLVERVVLYNGKEPVFDKFNIETEVNKSLSRKVWLKSGGYIFFDHTEALSAIDVNSGRFMGKKDHDANSLKINIEAAREIARQLRLRDIGGIIIVDFIDMVEEKNRKRLEEEFAKELKSDRAQLSTAPLSKFGIIEMTRQRVRPNLFFTISEPCSACLGTGRVISKTTVVARIERWIKRYRSEKGPRYIQLVVHSELAAFLKGGVNNRLRKLGWKYWTRIRLIEDDSLTMDEFRILDREGQEDLTSQFMP